MRHDLQDKSRSTGRSGERLGHGGLSWSRRAAEAAFPEAGSFSPAASDGEGWYAGTLFGDRADLALGPELAQRPA